MEVQSIKEILNGKSIVLKKALFEFNSSDSNEKVLLKYNLWSRYHFPKYFTSEYASFFKELDEHNFKAYC